MGKAIRKTPATFAESTNAPHRAFRLNPPVNAAFCEGFSASLARVLRSRSALFLLLLVFAGSALAACGGDDNAFKQDYNEAVRPLSSLGDEVGDSLTQAAGESNEELAARYEGLADKLDQVGDNLSGLEPPDDAREQLDELIDALAEGSERLRALGDAAEEGRPSEANAAASELVAAGERLREAETALRSAVDG